ncbi:MULTISPECIES: hypothetical protein [unclassified Paracoccus (in: a-proteobacteria)]|uniref:hypothetical protein n=1 Tax=unclassified Paracoccus (in: a-proteobacteria) TaxID=2688777 RepID=UPI001304D4B6|nr:MULTISPECIES: hypothetical protein [unclassified Paracoccus (in: a-proteobacteria)]
MNLTSPTNLTTAPLVADASVCGEPTLSRRISAKEMAGQHHFAGGIALSIRVRQEVQSQII